MRAVCSLLTAEVRVLVFVNLRRLADPFGVLTCRLPHGQEFNLEARHLADGVLYKAVRALRKEEARQCVAAPLARLPIEAMWETYSRAWLL